MSENNIKKQKIRIKVLIAPSGDYMAHGWRGASNTDPDETLYSCIEDMGGREYWITAELPIPNAPAEEIEGSIEQ